jgi:two-component system, NtrC family, response regulator AtoC
MPADRTPPSPIRLLIVEDEELQRRLFRANLGRAGRIEVETAATAEEALALLDQRPVDAVLTDVQMPGMNGVELTRAIRSTAPDLPIFLMTIAATVELAVEGMRAGATDFLPKPIRAQQFLAQLSDAVRSSPAGREVVARESLAGTHPLLDEARQFAARVARSPMARALVTGESGTGKSMLARLIHEQSGVNGRFVEINCAALPAGLLETELFGHEAGAFTDARNAKPGLIEVAAGGTLFLDEIGALPLELQSKLLLFLDGRGIRRVGGSRELVVSCRVITATNEDLQTRIRERQFRQDLYFRLNIAAIELPPLRRMPEVIPEIARLFVDEVSAAMGRTPPPVDEEALDALTAYPWPGNVRQLRHAVERALIFHGAGPLRIEPPRGTPSDLGRHELLTLEAGLTLDEVERRYITALLAANSSLGVGELAEVLGISRKTLWQKRREYGL